MRAEIHGLGWFVRRVSDLGTVNAFYRDVLSLPVVRAAGERIVFWGGETVAFVIADGGTPQPHFGDRSEASCTPIFRVRSLDHTVKRLRSLGVDFVNEPFAVPDGRLAYFRDPEGHITGLQERAESSTRAADVEWRRRRDAGELQLPGGPESEILGIGWVAVRCADLESEVAFYRDRLGLDVVQRFDRAAMLSLGDVTMLEVALGEARQTLPADRAEVPDTFVLRVSGAPALAAELDAAGVNFVGAPQLTGDRESSVYYFVDPEAHLLGIQQRAESSAYAEDVEARRRIAAGLRTA